MKPIVRAYTVELNVGAAPTAGQIINFVDYPELRNVVLYGIMAASNSTLAVSPTGKTVVADVVLTRLVLTLQDVNQKQRIYQYPCFDLSPRNVGGFYRDFIPFPINLVKSGCLILDAAGINPNESVCFTVLYDHAKR